LLLNQEQQVLQNTEGDHVLFASLRPVLGIECQHRNKEICMAEQYWLRNKAIKETYTFVTSRQLTRLFILTEQIIVMNARLLMIHMQAFLHEARRSIC
jgi:hypothetical protein